MSEKLIEALSTMKEKEALSLAEELLEKGADPLDILQDCKKAMAIVGDNFASGKYFLPELVMAGEMLLQISNIIKPKLQGTLKSEDIGRVVLGTVEGDLHDIGKDIVGLMLEVNGFEVIDMGVDVPPERFVEAIREQQVNILGLSGFLTLAIEPMRATIAAVRDGGPPDVKVMIGGGPVNQLVCDDIGADGWGANAMDAVSLAKKWAGVSKNGR